MSNGTSRSKQLAEKVIYETFVILKKAGGQLPGVKCQLELPVAITISSAL